MDIRRLSAPPPSAVIGIAAVAPLVVCAAVSAVHSSVPNVSAALLLVVVVVAAAATGRRAAGLVAAVSSALWFDVLLTAPRGQLAITSSADLEATVLLITVGVAVTELALWGRRQQAQASRTTGYLAALVDTAATATLPSTDPEMLTTAVAERIAEVLHLDRCWFVAGHLGGGGEPVLTTDGSVVRAGRVVDVTRQGLPVDTETALVVRNGGRVVGTFQLVAATRVVRPTADQLRVAVLLAEQVGAARVSA